MELFITARMPVFSQGVMSMGITIQAKNDCSFLFSSLGSAAGGVSGSNFLSDYYSIKNGSYAKLMKAYYSKDTANDSVKSIVDKKKLNTDAETKALNKVESATDALKESADALMSTGSDSVFNQTDITTEDEFGNETTVKGYDTEAIYKKVSQFIKDYNSVINAAKDTTNSSVANRTSFLMSATSSHSGTLSKMGITINKDNTLSIDKSAFTNADMTSVKSLFNGTGSYAYRVSAEASMINFAADHASSRSSTYTYKGGYQSKYSSGNLFNGYI